MSLANTESAQPAKVETHADLAGRKERLIAAIIDGLIIAVASIPVTFIVVFAGLPGWLATPIGMLAGVILFVFLNFELLKNSGQTIGKKMTGIQIVGHDRRLVAPKRILIQRYAPVWVASVIPFVGGFIVLLDALLIFREEKKCGHDEIAGTQVIIASQTSK